MNKPIIIAHRGAAKKAPENTMSSFKMALDMGAGGIELDVHLSSDDHLVVIHDEIVDRTSNGTGWVKDKTLQELRSLDFGSWFSPEFGGEQIPLLEEVLELIHGWDGLLNIELKSGPVFYPDIEKKVINLLNKFNMTDSTIISSFNHYSLAEIKKFFPSIRTGVLYGEGIYRPWDYAKTVGAEAIHPHRYNIVPEIVNGCKKSGIAVNPYTVDDPEEIARIAHLGVDGIITNVPDIALNILNEMGE